jgi:hypothetical protein
MRVGLRRIRAVLSLFKKLIKPADSQKIKGEIHETRARTRKCARNSLWREKARRSDIRESACPRALFFREAISA